MKSLNTYINEKSSEFIDGKIDNNKLDDVVKKLADFGLNAAVAQTTYQMANRIAKEMLGQRNAVCKDSINDEGKHGFWQIEEVLEKYFNKKEYKGETYWFDKSRKSIDSWLRSNNKGTMENPNI